MNVVMYIYFELFHYYRIDFDKQCLLNTSSSYDIDEEEENKKKE